MQSFPTLIMSQRLMASGAALMVMMIGLAVTVWVLLSAETEQTKSITDSHVPQLQRTRIDCHSLNATDITAYLRNGGKLEIAQQMTGSTQRSSLTWACSTRPPLRRQPVWSCGSTWAAACA